MSRTTLIMVALALVSLGTAVALRPVELTAEASDDTGDPLFAEFDDPARAARLEVQAWDPDAAASRTFQVELRDGRWIIPSHDDYPADATDRMGRAAGSFVDVKRDVIRSDDPDEHASFGVEDPSDLEASDGGRGQRITIADAGGNALVDVIVGKPVPDRPGHRFVRLPDSPRVYASRLSLDVSTEFGDWIEKDLMRIDASEVEGLISDPYRVDEAEGTIEGRDPISFVRGDLAELVAAATAQATGDADATTEPADLPADEWLTGPGIVLAEDERPDQAAIGAVVTAIDGLEIVDVRARPSLLTLEALQARGFFMNKDQRLFGNEGEVTIINDDGVTYTLYFGEETADPGLATGGGRYMFVQVQYDPEMDRRADPTDDGEQRGKARAEDLAGRFDPWFFVISDDSFRTIRRSRSELVKASDGASDR